MGPCDPRTYRVAQPVGGDLPGQSLMTSEHAVPRRRLLPRQQAALGLKVAAALALIPGYGLLAPPSHWDDPVLFVVLGVLAVIADRSEVRLPSGVGFDAKIALMLLAVALVGPLPALEIVVLPWLDRALTRRHNPSTAPAALTVPGYLAGYGWSAIVAALLLQSAGVDDSTAPAQFVLLIAAGAVLYTVGWALGPAIYIPLWLGQPFRVAVRAYVDMLPAASIMVVLATATILLRPLGLLALAMFALIAILPQSFLTYAGRARPVARLDPATATRRYAHALAVQLDLPRAQRRHLARVIAMSQQHPPTGEPIDYIRATMRDPSLASADAQLTTEWWNGGGGPIGLYGEAIPVAARVLAVAQTWAALTARGSPQLGHREAIGHLRDIAGARLDPMVVAAALAVIGQEPVTAAEPAPEPRLHHLRVPARLRRALAAG
jgi:hypothetical protein